MSHRRIRSVLKSRLMTAVLVFCIALNFASFAEAATSKKKSGSSGYNPRYASIVIDADTGAVLSQSNADKSLHPASLVKMMTLLMVFEGLEDGTLTLNERVRISNHAASQSPSKIGLKPGSSIALKDAIYALVTKSANDIAVAVGEHIGGTESRFAAMMNAKAKEIGMSRTHFVNASGLHHPSQVSSARDMAKLSQYIIATHPQYYRYFSTRNFTYNGVSYHNHNRLMQSFDGMDGIKTGYIEPSGFNLAASAVRGDRRLIAVVFGGRTSQSRNAHVADLLNRGFDRLGVDRDAPRVASLQQKSVPIPPRKPGSEEQVQVASAAGFQPNHDSPMGEMIGEGDVDPAVARRFETGMMAISALKGNVAEAVQARTSARSLVPPPGTTSTPPAQMSDPVAMAAYTPNAGINRSDDWSIQIGAFSSRVRSDQLVQSALGKLPGNIRFNAVPAIVPLKAGEGWVFRARIRGLTREQAVDACRYFTNCMTISPRAY